MDPVAMADTLPKIEDCRAVAVEYVNTCPDCGTVSKDTRDVPAWLVDKTIRETSIRCDRCAERKASQEETERRTRRAKNAMDHVAIPAEFSVWNPAVGNNRLARFIRDNRSLGIFVGGPYGCGKTRSAAYNLQLEAKAGAWCRFYRFGDLAADYARVCKLASEHSASFVSELMRHDIVLIDDIAKRRVTENAGELLLDIFDRVYSGMSRARLWITSNIAIGELAARFENRDIGDSLVSRIDRMIEAKKMVKIEELES